MVPVADVAAVGPVGEAGEGVNGEVAGKLVDKDVVDEVPEDHVVIASESDGGGVLPGF